MSFDLDDTNWPLIKATLIFFIFSFSAGVVATHIFYWFWYPNARPVATLGYLTVLHLGAYWGWFLGWFAFLVGICAAWNTATGKKHIRILEEAKNKARKIRDEANVHHQETLKKCQLLLEENEATRKLKREQDMIEVKALRKKLEKSDHFILNPGRFSREHKLLWKEVKEDIEEKEKVAKIMGIPFKYD